MKLEIKQLDTSSQLKESLNKSTERVRRIDNDDDQSSMIKLDSAEHRDNFNYTASDAQNAIRTQREAGHSAMNSMQEDLMASEDKKAMSPLNNTALLMAHGSDGGSTMQ